MKALRKDFWMEIRKSKARFISIFCIVALGVAFFSGIQASSPDMRFSGDAYFDDRELMDIRVMGTMGLTDADVEAVREVDGVFDAEGAYSTDVLCELENAQEVLHIESVNETVNRIEATEGRLPEKPGECFMDRSFAQAHGFQTGDSLTIIQDEDGGLLKRDTFTICGIGISPLYISFDRGNTTLGTGEIGGFAYVLPEDFDQEVFTQIYVRIRGAKELVSYSDAYENLVEKISDRLEAIQDRQCRLRYEQVVSDAEEELADAEKELEDGRREAEEELADAEKELKDAEKELEDGKKELEDGKKELEDAKKELADGRKELEDGKKELTDARVQIADAWQQVNDGRAQLASAKEQAASGWEEYYSGKRQLEQGEEQLNQGKKELADGKKELEQAKASLEENQKQLDASRTEAEEGRKQLETSRSALTEQKKQCEDGLETLTETLKLLPQVQAGVESAGAGTEQLKEALESARGQVDALQGALEAAQAAVTEKQTAVEAAEARESALKETLDSARGQADALQGALETAQTEVNSRQGALEAAQARYNEADASFQEGTITEEELEAFRRELSGAQAALAQAQQAEESAEQELAGARQAAESAEQELSGVQQSLEVSRQELSGAQQSAAAMEAPLAEAVQGLDALTQQYETAAGQLEELEQQLEALNQAAAQKAVLEESLAQIEAGFAQIAAQEEVLAGGEAELAAGQKAIDDGWKEIAASEEELKPYEEEIAANEKTLEDSRKQLEAGLARLISGQDQIDASEAELASAEAEIRANEKKLADGEKEIEENEKKLADGEKELADGEKEIKENEEKLADGEKELADGWKEYEEAKADAEEEIADGEKEIADARKEIDELEVPEWLLADRNELPEYADYGDNADRIRNIGRVFPVIFFLVAALISLTTMTRMVEEQRTQIGTLKALGYGKLSIASKYLNYALIATVGGSFAGVLIGEKILPYIIIKAYGIMYHSMSSILRIDYEWKFALMASAAAVVCTLGATIFACYKELVDTPASLMRPPAPKEGKRVLAERITFLWKHLNFTWKSTLRNLFRYKKRLFMTIFGISGSMALMLVGYGIKDSVGDIVARQYKYLQHYDGMIIDDEDASDEEREELLEYLKGNEKLSHFTQIHFTSLVVPRDRSNISAYVYVPEDLETFTRDITLQDRVTEEPYQLTDEGAVISEKTASLLGLSVGDMLPMERDRETFQVKITAITENYMGHYIYMTPKVYEEIFREKPEFRDIVFTMKPEYLEDAEEVGHEILEFPAALSISYTKSIASQVERMISTLSMVIVVLIISAGMLAFVVLYNLNNINITERQRELATLKVLGFYDQEVSQYVLRENVLLTILSIFAGSGFGILLHRFIIVTVEVDSVMFGRNIRPVSFLYCALFTIGFSVVVNGAMHFKLKKIDMVESLKSVE